MNPPDHQLLHKRSEREQSTSNLFRHIRERLNKAILVLFSEKSHDESRKGCRVHTTKAGMSIELDARQIQCNVTYLSACMMTMPVIRSIGTSDWSISTTRICEVTAIKPPCLYKFCLCSHQPLYLQRYYFSPPVFASHFITNNSQTGTPAAHCPKFLSDSNFLF